METIVKTNKINSVLLAVSMCTLLLLNSCSGDEDNKPKATFEYTIAGGVSKEVEGTDAEFFTDGGIFYIGLLKDTEFVSIQIYTDPIIEKSYALKTETNADVQTGSVFTGDFHNFISDFGAGGSVSITSVEANVVTGNFTMNMDNNSPTSPIVVNVSGSFTAIKRPM